MEPELIRNIPSVSEEEQALLGEKRVFIAGCGGLGGYLLENTVRLGVGHLRLADGDVFERSNRNRQLLSLEENLGQSKVLAARDRAKAIRPGVEVEAVREPVTEANVSALLAGCDAVLDGLDNVASRRLLAKAAQEAGIPYVYGAVQGWTAQAGILLPEDLDVLYPRRQVPGDKSVLAFTPALCAGVQCALGLRALLGHAPEPGLLHYFDLREMQGRTVSLR